MKKNWLWLGVLVLLLSGCEEKKENLETELSNQITLDTSGAKVVCTIDDDTNLEQGYVTGAKFAIFGDEKGIATKLMSIQVASSNDKKILTELEDNYEDNNEKMAQYDGYDVSLKAEGNKLTVTTTIDYTALDSETLAGDNESLKVYLNEDNQFTVESLKAMLVSVGVTCQDQ